MKPAPPTARQAGRRAKGEGEEKEAEGRPARTTGSLDATRARGGRWAGERREECPTRTARSDRDVGAAEDGGDTQAEPRRLQARGHRVRRLNGKVLHDGKSPLRKGPTGHKRAKARKLGGEEAQPARDAITRARERPRHKEPETQASGGERLERGKPADEQEVAEVAISRCNPDGGGGSGKDTHNAGTPRVHKDKAANAGPHPGCRAR